MERTRKRPEFRKGRPTLTREAIGRAVLELGDAELTMRALAAHLEVTPRALYKYVADRDDAVRLAADQLQSQWAPPELDPAHWRDSLRELCLGLLDLYRRHPAALRLAETTALDVHDDTRRGNEAMLAFFAALGLPPGDAHRAWRQTIAVVAGHSEIERWRARSSAHREMPEDEDSFDDVVDMLAAWIATLAATST
ncbi:TetR/AcrR family transcriptional regulator [Nonomuraea endophytica]|uniref:AcrR family transcriptional regulator n=1 Tax=Nonomuraea endophytica TaxID=714136 RepID=A0A7W8A0Y2_9ACTN|nr:TetR/AcrR family transcriptional regulator C-terminal domain-containing protein [Nonomuraea endophytica]MBB5077527.1 AcrR family transcriptional regulator [Nonomuraea endophytica]